MKTVTDEYDRTQHIRRTFARSNDTFMRERELDETFGSIKTLRDFVVISIVVPLIR